MGSERKGKGKGRGSSNDSNKLVGELRRVGEDGKSDGLLSLVVVNCHCHRVPNIAGSRPLSFPT